MFLVKIKKFFLDLNKLPTYNGWKNVSKEEYEDLWNKAPENDKKEIKYPYIDTSAICLLWGAPFSDYDEKCEFVYGSSYTNNKFRIIHVIALLTDSRPFEEKWENPKILYFIKE